MLTARFVPLLSALAVAGSLSMKRVVPVGPGTFRTDNPTFVILLLAVIVIVAALTFFPAVLLGPVVQGLTDQLGFPTYEPGRDMRRDLTASIVAAVAFTLLFGLAYPLIATGVSQVLFPNKSDGSQVKVDGKTVGSKLIGQSFTIRQPIPPEQRGKFGKKQIKTPDPKYFQPRPSVTTYSPDVTFFNNLGPNNKDLMQQFKGYIAKLPGPGEAL